MIDFLLFVKNYQNNTLLVLQIVDDAVFKFT